MSGKLVFVSYAHDDEKFLKGTFLPFLKQLELNEQIELWHDRLIGVGEDWYEQIADKLDHAKVAILLVTQNFLASRFCLHEETPVLLQRARRGELHLFPLLVEPCHWENERWLARAQMWPGGQSLEERDATERKRLLTEFAKRVLAAVNGPPATPPILPQFDTAHATHDLHRLPFTDSLLFGRRMEIQLLDRAWNEARTNVAAFTAGGGVGKSTLARVWAEMLAEDGWRGAERAFAWSFYSQGTGRMTDSETFLNEALAWFGANADEWQGRSIWERAELLADRVRRQRTLLILDGVEPLQSGDHVDRGCLRDPGLRTLLEELADDHPGLCVVTTRERLVDLEEMSEPAVVHHDLDRVDRLAGRALLRVERVRGTDDDLEKAVDNLGGQALAVSLAGRLLKDGSATPHVSGLKALPALAHPVEEGGHARRVLEAWARRLGESAELELLSVVGLFDRPADLRAVEAVIDADPLPGLNAHLRTADLEQIVDRLSGVQLLAGKSTHEDTLDTHPLVREHFGARLEERHPTSWAEGHRRLYEHFKDTTEDRPEGLPAMQPLFAAVVHGCAAGLYQDACDEVYIRRIIRGNEYYLTTRLGAFAADLSCLSHFFAERWQRPQPALSRAVQSWVIWQAGLRLRGVGRVLEALGPMEEGLALAVAEQAWTNAAISAANLNQLYVMIGELKRAEARAREALEHTKNSDDRFLRMLRRTTHANVLHQLGRISEARALFAEAERLQAEDQRGYPLLYSVRGYEYYDLLLGEGEAGEVLWRAAQTLKWVTTQGWLQDIALDHLSLGRAHLVTSPPDFAAAKQHLQEAVDGLRNSGYIDNLPRGFLARAAFHRLCDDLPRARKDLDTVRKLVRRHGLRLFEADLALEETRFHLAARDKDAATATLGKARELITEMSYGRRLKELAELEAELGTSDA